jgi:NAD dependent epimerase/dehydratase family enzyme
VRNADFARALTRALRRPGTFWRFYLPFGPPDFLLGLVLGDVAQVITTGQKALPDRALALGYTFQFPDLEGALADLFPRPGPAADPRPIPAASGART